MSEHSLLRALEELMYAKPFGSGKGVRHSRVCMVAEQSH